jgi:glycosyltransferase involved in cell wall biosynthesis
LQDIAASSYGHILYIGGYLDEDLVKSRKLPGRNPAGSNRMIRLASSICSTGRRVVILSPGISVRAGLSPDFFHRAEVRHKDKVATVFSSVLSIPIIGALSSFIFFPLAFFSLLGKRNFDAVIIYNFSPLLVMMALLAKYVMRLPVIHNVEDISEPKLRDWLPKSAANPLQQIIFGVSMKWISRMSNGIICPTRKFLPSLPKNKPIEIVTGCISLSQNSSQLKKQKTRENVRILFAGKMEEEHGVDMFLEALQLLASKYNLENGLRVDMCGQGSLANWVRLSVDDLAWENLHFHGFVSDSLYRSLLDSADICIALQRPEGRYGKYKTPSKVYEYLAYGKAVVATDVGDLSLLPKEVICVCKNPDARRISEALLQCLREPSHSIKMGVNAKLYARENFSLDVVGSRLVEFIDKKILDIESSRKEAL